MNVADIEVIPAEGPLPLAVAGVVAQHFIEFRRLADLCGDDTTAALLLVKMRANRPKDIPADKWTFRLQMVA